MSKKLDNISLRSEEVQEILSKVPNWMIRWGNVLLLILIIILLTISWFIKYPDIIPAQAIITTQLPPQKEYAKVTGKIDKLLVKNNTSVYSGQLLAVIQNTANYKDVFFLKKILDTIKVSSKGFKFPMDSVPFLSLGEINSDYALFQNNYLQYNLNKDLKPFSNESLANELSLKELHIRLKNMQSQKEINQSELEYKMKSLGRSQILYDKGVISTVEFENKKLKYLQAKRTSESMKASISQLREAINNANSTYRGTEINKAEENISLLKNVIQSFNQLNLSIKNWQLKYLLKSDIEGKVSFQNLRVENETVNQGELVFTIVPDHNTNYIAILKTPIQNSGKIQIDQKVNIKLENYPDTEFGVLQGTVQSISLVPTSEGFYSIKVSLPQELLTSYGKLIKYKPEMSGAAEIITENLSLFDRFFYQFKKLL